MAGIFTDACELPPENRCAFLDSVCGDDQQMKRDLAQMLEEDAGHARDWAGNSWAELFAGEIDRAENASCELPPERIGSFRILAKIGEGGMGAVYHAVREADYEQHAAIKLLKRNSDTAQFRQRFRSEVQFLAKLGGHPNIAGLLEAGSTDEGVPYLVMEYVDGRRIDRYCDEHGIAVQERLELLLQVCAAVQFAHQHTVIHRDIKPNNILVTDDRTCRLIDFGIAKLLDPDLTEGERLAAQTAYRALTPEYASPEQSRGEPLTTASDVYSLGVVLYELLTGHRPFDPGAASGLPFGRVASHCEPERPSSAIHRTSIIHDDGAERRVTPESVSRCRNALPYKLRRELAGDLDNIVLTALRNEPERRYGSAEQLAADIRRHLDGLPVLARKDTLRYRCGKFVRRNRLAVGAACLLALSLAGGVVGVAVQWLRAERESARAARAAEQANSQRDWARWEQYRANITAAIGAVEQSNSAVLGRLLNDSPIEHRNWEWRYADSQQDMSIRSLPGPKHYVSDVEFSPDGRRLATISQAHTVQLWNTADYRRVGELAGHNDEIWECQFSADGARLVTASLDRTARLWDARSGAEIAVLGQLGHNHVRFSPNGRLVAAACDDHTVRLWDARDGVQIAVFAGHDGAVTRVAFRPDGSQLASASSDGAVRLWDIETRSEAAVLSGHESPVRRLAYSPDGGRLVSAGDFPDTTIRMWDTSTGELVAVMSGHENTVHAVAFNPAGDHIASASEDQTARVWDGRSGEAVAVLRGHRDAVYDAQFIESGSQIATASGDATIRLWDAATGKRISVLRGHTDSIGAIAVNPDETLLASSANDGSVRLWSIQPGVRDGVLRGHDSFVYGVAVSPDDSRIASAAWDGVLRIWDMDARKQIDALDGDVAMYTSVAFSPDGDTLACGCNERTLHVWDLATREKHVVGSPAAARGPYPVPVAFSPDGQWIATLDSDDNVYLWSTDTGEKKVVCQDDAGVAIALAFRPDGQQLAIGTLDDRLLSWDVRAEQCVEASLPADAKVYAIAFSCDGARLAVGGENHVLHILDTATWAPVARLRSPGYTYSIAFSVGDERMASGCRDNTIRIWDTSTWQLVAELTGHQNYVHGLAFSNDGTRLVSGSGDSTVRIWDTVPLRSRVHQ